jgi:hypothetical protein
MRNRSKIWAVAALTAVALAGPALGMAQQRQPPPAAKAPAAAAQAPNKVVVYKSPT